MHGWIPKDYGISYDAKSAHVPVLRTTFLENLHCNSPMEQRMGFFWASNCNRLLYSMVILSSKRGRMLELLVCNSQVAMTYRYLRN
jgi:hypothetical protein